VIVRREVGHVPMRITARMANSVVTTDGISHIDGILAAAAFGRLPRDERDALPLPQHTARPIDVDVPLARWACAAPAGASAALLDDDGLVWGWCGSSMHARWTAEETRAVRRRPPMDAYARYTDGGTENIAAGPRKAVDIALPARLAESIEWYALGDIDAVRDLLGDVHHLGRVRNHGSGEVLEWTVEPIDDDRSCVWQGRPVRALPTSWPGVRGHVRLAGLRAPYWHPSRRCPVFLPDGGAA